MCVVRACKGFLYVFSRSKKVHALAFSVPLTFRFFLADPLHAAGIRRETKKSPALESQSSSPAPPALLDSSQYVQHVDKFTEVLPTILIV